MRAEAWVDSAGASAFGNSVSGLGASHRCGQFAPECLSRRGWPGEWMVMEGHAV